MSRDFDRQGVVSDPKERVQALELHWLDWLHESAANGNLRKKTRPVHRAGVAAGAARRRTSQNAAPFCKASLRRSSRAKIASLQVKAPRSVARPPRRRGISLTPVLLLCPARAAAASNAAKQKYRAGRMSACAIWQVQDPASRRTGIDSTREME